MTDRADYAEAFYLLSEELTDPALFVSPGENHFQSEDHFIAVSLGWRTRRLNHHEYCSARPT